MLSIVLSRRDFREHDQIVSVYTKEKGKLSLLVRGVKKIVSKNSAHLEPFSIVDITVEKGKEVDYLTRVQSVDYLRKIRENLDKSLVAGYIVSIVDKLFAEEERDVKFFVFLESFLFAVNELEDFNNQKALLMLDSFMVNLLYFLGFTLSSEEKIVESSIFELLTILEKSDFEEIFNLDFELYSAKNVHRTIHTWCEHFLERKVVNWALTCIV
ncbi:MAG: DNA repair protein RecO [Candidatus Magasanikbacteria bacterium CG_4_10_14_0_2_um_filter_33_14]|uniref:DNA repair protein RecO n=1 Tax=Candidatus Magasanikbacteria bacterium CG_4_10_14_0_2_um_filter_33_14 TaxID=1974636 RepID=A0A2M7V8K4_9BACT|nr:MAG: DNA repair protein RecO [Candidatus Magasanikbacteria bacterium CG_4_10_14_0_2_um_filter_33_14]